MSDTYYSNDARRLGRSNRRARAAIAADAAARNDEVGVRMIQDRRAVKCDSLGRKLEVGRAFLRESREATT
jgi:hypothetical protein